MQLWITGSEDNTIRAWNSQAEQIYIVNTFGGVTALCIDKNMGHVIAATTDHALRVYEMKTEKVKKFL